MRRRLPFPLSLFGLALLAQSAGCASIVGLDSFTDAPAGGAGGEAGGGAGAGTTGGGGAGAGTTGGGGVGAGLLCEPGTYQACAYGGPQGTEGVGTCKAGERVCNTDGDGYGACMGEVLPVDEDCSTPADESCDGEVNELCPCNPGEPATCYGGPAGTVGVGTCQAGTQLCNDNGLGFGPCTGQVLPAAESCATPGDEDCDGQVDEGCLCEPGTSEPCYTGPQGTKSTGVCQEGMHTCNGDGLGYGPCVGEVVPSAEACTGSLDDEDCDGQVNESGAGCVCVPGASQPCYSFGTGTPGVGICAEGSQLCNAQGTGFDACTGDVGPGVEDCSNGADDDCDGSVCAAVTIAHSWGTTNETLVSVGDATGPYVGGVFSGSITVGAQLVSAGSSDWYAAKFDSSGQPVWAKRWGDASNQNVVSTFGASASGIVIGGTRVGTVDFGGGPISAGSYMLAKFDAQGNHSWSRSISGPNITEGAVDSQGNVYIVGGFTGSVDLGTGTVTSVGGNDIIVAKLSGTNGATLWTKRYGDASGQAATRVTVDPVDGVVVWGTNGGTFSFGMGNVTGNTVMARLDANGNAACSKGFPDSLNVTDTTTDSSGNIYATGSFTAPIDAGGGLLPFVGFSDVYVAKYASACVHLWSQSLGGDAYEYDPRVETLSGGDIMLALQAQSGATTIGSDTYVNQGLYDSFAARFDTLGAQVWSRQYAGPGIDENAELAADANNLLWAIVRSSGPIDFGSGQVPAGTHLIRVSP